MKNKLAKRTCINVAVVESDPLRFAGFKAVLDSESDLQLTALALTEIGNAQDIDVVLVAGRSGQSAFRDVEMLRAIRSDLRIIITGTGLSDSTMLDTLASGAKGYIDEAGSVKDFVKAIRIVADGKIWAPRRVLAAFIERSSNNSRRSSMADRKCTCREKEVLELLVQGTPNREIGRCLGIEERTVKAPCSQADAQSWRSEPHPAFSPRFESRSCRLDINWDTTDHKPRGKSMFYRRGNRNWSSGKCFEVPPAAPTAFEAIAQKLQLSEQMYTGSQQLRDWCELNKSRCYIPEWLLQVWRIQIDLDRLA